jgi:transposase
MPDPAMPSPESLRLEVLDVGHLTLLAAFWDDLGFSQAIDACVPCDPQVKLTVALALKALVLNLTCGRDALYRVELFFQKAPVDLLLGHGVTAADLNDDALGRTLDRLFLADGEQVFHALALRVIERERLDLHDLHGDTTSKLVFGKYKAQDDEAIAITFGHSKDHRPDLKQVKAGIATTRDGVPLVAQMLDGNHDDKTWHQAMLGIINSRMKVAPGQAVEYIGDSALITQANLDIAAKHHILLTGRLPRNVKACDELVAEAMASEEGWEDLGQVSPGLQAASYRGKHFVREVLGHTVQLGVYRPRGANERAIKAVKSKAQRALDQAVNAAEKLTEQVYGCAGDAQRALAEFVERHGQGLVKVKGEVVTRKVQGKHAGPGRPKAGAVRPVVEQVRVEVQLETNAAEVERQEALDSCFVLLHTGTAKLGLKELLQKYKGQAVVETRFPFLKDPLLADMFFVKKPGRVEALGYVMMMALLLWSVWQRRVRTELKASGEKPLVDVTKMKKPNPTAMVCVYIMAGIKVVRFWNGGQASAWRLAAPLEPEQERVVRFSKVRMNPALPVGAVLHVPS